MQYKEREIIEVKVTGTIQQTIEIVDHTWGDISSIVEALNNGELHTTVEHYGSSTIKGTSIEDENGLLVARVVNQTNLLEGGTFNGFTYVGTQEPDID